MLMMPLLVDAYLRFTFGGTGYFSLDLIFSGYFPNPSKTCLVVKESFYNVAVKLFQDSGISIEGRQHLGGALGSPSFKLLLLLSRKESLYIYLG